MDAAIERLSVTTTEARGDYARMEIVATLLLSSYDVRLDEVDVSNVRSRLPEIVNESVRCHIVATPGQILKGGAE